MYEEKPSPLPFVESIWYARVDEAGEYDDPAKDTWSLAFTLSSGGEYKAEVGGPLFGCRKLDSTVGDQYWGAELSPFVTMRGINKHELPGKFVELPITGSTFKLGGIPYEIPSYDELEGFLVRLEKEGIIGHQARALAHQAKASERSRQRSYRRVVGLTRKQLDQIKRAKKAITLLKQGRNPSEVAALAGYADQAHLNRALANLFGKTPSQLTK